MRPSNLITGTEHSATKLFPESKTAADEAQNKVKKMQSSLDHANAIVETVKSENQVWSLPPVIFSESSFLFTMHDELLEGMEDIINIFPIERRLLSISAKPMMYFPSRH